MQSPFYKQNKIVKVDISLKQLLDVDTTNELYYRRTDNIFPNQVLTSYTNQFRRDAFRFKYLTDLIQAGTGVTITNNDGVLTISSTGGGGGSSPLTTKGDLYTYDTADARLPVGTNGQILYADSTTATGLKWDTAPTGGSGIPFATASGIDTYTTTVTGVASYTDGDVYIIRFTNGNTDGSTLNINGLGAKTLYKNNDGPIIGGDIWDGAEMLCVYNLVLDAFDCIGTSPNTLYAYVTNVNGSTITKGQAVFAFGGTGNRMTVKLAQANTDATSAQTIGFVYSTSINDNQKGIIIIQGYFTGLSLFPTATWNDGDPVYLSPTTPGAVTNTKPYAPSHLVYLGIVATANNGSAGRMYVRVQNGYELDELHNVQAQTPTYKDTLWYDNTVSPAQWKTASIATILGYTPADINSPAFTGNPTAPTPASGDNDTSIATTAFVTSAIQQSLSFVGYFGAGTDGNVTISGAVTLTKDMFYNDLTIAAGGSLYLAGYRIFVKGTLDLTNAGVYGIHNNGYAGGNNAGVPSGAQNGAGTAGRGGYGSTVYGWFVGGAGAGKHKGSFGGPGGAGASVNGTNGIAISPLLATEGFLGGRGGSSGVGGNSATATGGLGTTGQVTGISVAGYTTHTPQTFIVNPSVEHSLFHRIRQDTSLTGLGSYTATTYIYYGAGHGAGGGGGASTSASVAGMGGGAGGGGGGTVVIFARNIIVGPSTNAEAISARGGDGGTGGSQPTFNGTGGGGAGAGGGGFIYLVVGSISGTTGITFASANGGTGGLGGTARGAGNFGGQGGSGGYGGKITVTNLSTNTLTVVDSTATAAATAAAATGIAGTAGTAGATCTYSS